MHPLIARELAKPITHEVRTTYANGRVRTHGTRSAATAENYAITERRYIGRTLIERATGQTVTVVSVNIVAL
jgi:hypothetical protein